MLAAKTPFMVSSVVREDNWPKEHFWDRSLFTRWTSKAITPRIIAPLDACASTRFGFPVTAEVASSSLVVPPFFQRLGYAVHQKAA